MDMKSSKESEPGKTNPIYNTMYESISCENTVLPVLRNQMYREPVFDLIQENKNASKSCDTKNAQILPTITIWA